MPSPAEREQPARAPHVRELTLTAMLLAMALALSAFERLLPPLPTPLPMHYGLANVAIMAALIWVGTRAAFFVTLGKIMFALITRGLVPAFVSLVGSLAALAVMATAWHVSRRRISLLLLSVGGAVTHNAGQLAVFALLSRVPLHPLSLVGLMILLGVITGLLSAALLGAMRRPAERYLTIRGRRAPEERTGHEDDA